MNSLKAILSGLKTEVKEHKGQGDPSGAILGCPEAPRPSLKSLSGASRGLWGRFSVLGVREDMPEAGAGWHPAIRQLVYSCRHERNRHLILAVLPGSGFAEWFARRRPPWLPMICNPLSIPKKRLTTFSMCCKMVLKGGENGGKTEVFS